MTPTMLTPAEVAKHLKISYEAALGFIKYSGIYYIKVGRQYRVSEENLNRFLAQKGQITVDISGNL